MKNINRFKILLVGVFVFTILFGGLLSPFANPVVVEAATGSGQGESVDVTYSFSNVFLNNERKWETWQAWDGIPTIQYLEWSWIYSSNDKYGLIECAYAAENDPVSVFEFLFKIQTGVRGTISIEWYVNVTHNAAPLFVASPEETDTITVLPEYIDHEGYTTVYLYARAKGNAASANIAQVNVLNVVTNDFDTVDQDLFDDGFTEVYAITMYIDQIIFEPDPISSAIRSTYEITNPESTLHEVLVPNFSWDVELEIVHPIHWEFSNCTPNADVAVAAGTTTLTNTVGLDYEVKFVADDSLRISQVQEIWSDGFEGGQWDNEWTGASPADSLLDEYAIVFEGARSTHMIDANYGYYSTDDPDIVEGDYIITFSTYIVSGRLQFYYRSGGAWMTAEITGTGYWNTSIVFIEDIEFYQSSWFMFKIPTGAGECYVDNVRLYNRTLYSVQPLDAQAFHITSYGLFEASYETISYMVDEDGDDIMDINATVTTDAFGNWEGDLSTVMLSAGTETLLTYSNPEVRFFDGTFSETVGWTAPDFDEVATYHLNMDNITWSDWEEDCALTAAAGINEIKQNDVINPGFIAEDQGLTIDVSAYPFFEIVVTEVFGGMRWRVSFRDDNVPTWYYPFAYNTGAGTYRSNIL